MYSMNHGHVFAAQRETHSPFNDLRASNDSIFRIRTFYGFSTEVLRVPSTQNIGSTLRKTNSACWLMTAWPKRTGTRSFIPPSRTVLNSKRCRKWRSLSPLWKKSTPLPVVYSLHASRGVRVFRQGNDSRGQTLPPQRCGRQQYNNRLRHLKINHGGSRSTSSRSETGLNRSDILYSLLPHLFDTLCKTRATYLHPTFNGHHAWLFHVGFNVRM